MSSFSMTVEDSSPLITYAPAGAWIDTPNNDSFAASYMGASYHITSVQGATATLTFNGTGVSIFGGMRSNYGTYIMTVDGDTVKSGSAEAGNYTRQLLGTVSGLSYSPHTAVLTNVNGAPIDIDWIDFEAQLGVLASSQAVSTAQIDNTDPNIVYSPVSTWHANISPLFFNKTLSFTQTPGASASLTFSGGAIAVYGTVSPDHADIVITVDGQTHTLPGGASGFANMVHPQTLLYYQSDLDPASSHLLEYSGNSKGAGAFIDLDMISVFTDDPLNDTTVTSSSSGTLTIQSTLAPSASSLSASSVGGSSTSRHLTGTIVGAVLGGLAALLFFLGLLTFFLLRRRRQKRSTKIDKSMISVSPVLPMQKDPKTPVLPFQEVSQDLETGGGIRRGAFPFPVVSRKASSLRHSIAPSYYSDPIDAHSRDTSVSSMQSSTPLAPALPSGVPRINIPQPRNLSSPSRRKPAPTGSSSGLNYDSISTPARPNTRPPTIDFTQMETPH